MSDKERIITHCDRCLDRNEPRELQGLGECWEKLPGMPGCLGEEEGEKGHEGEWRAGT